MTQAALAITLERPGARMELSLKSLMSALLGLFALDNILLLHFWGLPLIFTIALALLSVGTIGRLCCSIPNECPAVSVRTFAISFVIALCLFALGGEGHIFYANTDWQIRDAVLRDLATNPWPFAYDIHGTAYFLRAPVGLYLLPAMFGRAAELALLLSDSVRLALLLCLAWHLFEDSRERIVALAVSFLFSGWDLAGTALYWSLGRHPSWDHIEAWNTGSQYSSHVTQAFWVPQHAMAGWTCAVVFLLWRKGLVPIGVFAASLCVVAIWSPLAIIGAVPFALFAAVAAFRRGAVTPNDIALGLVAIAISGAALLYLEIDAANVGMHIQGMRPAVWALCIGLEVLPFAWPLLFASGPRQSDPPVALLTVLLLFVMPLGKIGASIDFQMRASIMPLLVLSIFFAKWICNLLKEEPLPGAAITYAVLAMLLGAATPLLELKRSLVNGRSPRPLCSLVGVWNKQDGMIVPYATYFAPVAKLPSALRYIPVTAGRSDPDKCWKYRWVIPRNG